MPIVFVHGVNNRKEDADYAQGVERTRGFLKDILAPRLKLDAAKLSTFFPYWGDQGVKFRWNQASLPSASDNVETLSLAPPGPGSGDFELWLGEARYQYGPGAVSLGEISRNKSFEEAVDLLWDTASAVAPAAGRHNDVVEGYLASLAYASKNPAPAWAMQTPPLGNDAFVQTLLKEIEPFRPPAAGPVQESLGLKDWFQSLKESVIRLGSLPSDATTSLVVGLGRQSVHEKASRFLGDAFVYLDERGTDKEPGPIVQAVVSDLEKARNAKQPGDDRLIVIGHSLGGVIVYDIATYFRPELKIDVFASIGSQVALFEEMTLYRASRKTLPLNPPKDKLPKPGTLDKWLNVFDANDVFSFQTETVFDGPKDYRFDTGYGLLQAHGGYFARPSFYKRLAERLA
jgi:hypothetical protein